MTDREKEIIDAVKCSTSIRKVLELLDLKPAGGNYKTIKNLIKKLDINVDHMKGQGWSKNTERIPKRNMQEYLSNSFPIQSNSLKKRLIFEKIFEKKCSCCNLSIWLDKPIPLELDHIDGNCNDNSLINLRLLCPNCHAFTPTYRGKNIKNSTY